MQQISMPILPLIDQKQLHADTIISPVVEMTESRKLSVTPNRSPIENPSRYNPNPGLAPGIDPWGQFPQDTKPELASNVMHTYPPPQMVPFKAPQPPQINGYAAYAVNNGHNYPSQTYPGLQQPPKSAGGYPNGLQIPTQPYQNGNMQNSAGQYGMTPISTVQQQQAMYTDSPVETTAFPAYFPQEPNDLTGMPYNPATAMQYPQQQGTYQGMQYLNTQQQYQYQGQ
jgi:hypothetical protein